MKFDIIEFAQNYDLFYSIAGDFYGAIGLYLNTIAFIFVFAFVINGLTIGRLPSFKGKKALMGITLAMLMFIIGEIFYSLLEFLKMPLAWLYKHLWLLVGCFFGLIILIGIITLAVVIVKDKVETKEKCQNEQKNNTKEF